jgi:hypothetical protein
LVPAVLTAALVSLLIGSKSLLMASYLAAG